MAGKTLVELAREIRLKATQLDTVWSADRENRMIVAGIEKGKQEVIKKIESIDKRHTVGFVLQALKGVKDV